MSRTFDDKLQWDLRTHRHGLLEAIVAGNPKSLDRVLDVIGLESTSCADKLSSILRNPSLQ